MNQISKEIAPIKKENIKSNESYDSITGYNIINGFYIICLKNKTNENIKLEYNIEKKGEIEILTNGFEKKENGNKLYINDTLNPSEVKIYILLVKENNISITTSCTYLKGSKGNKNTLINKDYSFYNFNVLNESNKNLKGIIFSQFNTPKHKKIQHKVYEKINLYEDDNLIKGLNQDRGNKNRQIRAINQENNIHSFGEFKSSYKNETYSKQNIHGFKNKENEKVEIKKESNKSFFYMKNENSSMSNFGFLNKKENESIFDKNEIKDEKKEENSELNDFSLISKYIDCMELVEKKENPNISYMEVRRKYSKIWNELSDKDKMVYALFFEMSNNDNN